MIWLAVGCGGALGALARHGVGTLFGARPPESFPWSTWLVNVLGCLAIGVLLALAERSRLDEPARAFLVTGLLGSFTTFSTFGHETVGLVEQGRLGTAGVYLAASLGVGLAAVVLGRQLGA